METELHSLQNSSSWTSNLSIRDEHRHQFHPSIVRYTSLKDILSDPEYSPTNRNSNDFTSSTISIKNHLVKHAASVYLQSAAIIAAREQNWFGRMWRRERSRSVGLRWDECASGPLGFCIKVALRVVRRIMARASSHIVVEGDRRSLC